MTDLTDAAVIERVLGGDSEAYALLVERYESMGMRYAYGLLLDRQDAQDALNESFFRAYRALAKLKPQDDGELRFGPWFLTIVHNRCCDMRKQRGRRRQREVAIDDDRPIGAPDSAEAAIERDALGGMLRGLNLTERNVLLLKYYYGWDYREIGAMLGVKEGTLHSIASRAKEKLRIATSRE